MGIPLFLLAVPLMLMLAVNNGIIAEVNTRFISIPKLNGFRANELGFHNVINNFKPDDYNIFYEIFANDHCQYNVIPKFGTLYYISIPILIYGLFLCVKKSISDMRQQFFSLDILMVILFVSAFIVALFIERPNVNRSCAIYIPLIYFLVAGFLEIFKNNKILTVITAGIYLFCFLFFLQYYFKELPKDLEHDYLFSSLPDLKKALAFSEEVYQEDETVYILGRSNPYIYTILALQVDPYTFNDKKVLSYDGYVKKYDKYRFQLDAILPDCIYIFRDLHNIPEEIGNFPDFLTKEFGSVIVFYPDKENS